MMRLAIRRYAIVFAAWLPFFAIWVLFSIVYAHYRLGPAIVTSLFSMGSASLLGIATWHLCRRLPWPLRLDFKFYVLQIFLGCAYSLLWTAIVFTLEGIQRGTNPLRDFWKYPFLGWQLLMGVWLYGVFAGVSYAVQTRDRLREKEALAARAEALLAEARLDAVRARLNPHFLFNALHTLSALVKFRPAQAESAVERLGDMLRYTLKEDGRELVEFSEEYEFTRQYLAFEQLRYEERLKVEMQIDAAAFEFDVLPFSLQTLAENAVRHAISVRPEGGSIWIRGACGEGKLTLTVRDDGPGGGVDNGPSHQFGLRSLRERLVAAFGAAAELRIKSGVDGFEASFDVPAPSETSSTKIQVGDSVGGSQ